jgi:hypothetical protein
MASNPKLHAVALAVVSLLAAVAAAGAAPDDVVLADDVRIAFYEAAPGSMETSMRNAVDEACSATDPASWAWLCAGEPLRFLREVNVLGARYQTGLVCSEEVVTPDLRYYTPDMFEDELLCQYVAYDARASTHLLSLDPVAATDAAQERKRD